MIHVTKGEKPEVLVKNAVLWRDEYLAAKAENGPISTTVRYRYRHHDIKTALRLEAHGKCVYCETKIPIGEADHVLPVRYRPDLIVEWQNLLLVCKECNTNKGDYYSVAEPLIDPSVDSPEKDVYFFGPAIMPRDGSVKGFRSIHAMKLARADLLQRRLERVERLRPLIQEWRGQQPGPTKDLLRNAILEESRDDAEYSSVVRAYLFQELGWEVD